MRQVNVFKNILKPSKDGTNRFEPIEWERVFDYIGWFHGISTEGEIDSDRGEMFPVAVVEDLEGKLHTPPISEVEFIDTHVRS